MLLKPLFFHFKPPKGYDRHPHRFVGKVIFWAQLDPKKSAEIAIYVQGGFPLLIGLILMSDFLWFP